MASQNEQQEKDRKVVPGTTGQTTKDTSERPAAREEEHTYDPVGMAGKKAGKVEEIEEQLQQERTDDPATHGAEVSEGKVRKQG